jgi:hypothetical protein
LITKIDGAEARTKLLGILNGDTFLSSEFICRRRLGDLGLPTETIKALYAKLKGQELEDIPEYYMKVIFIMFSFNDALMSRIIRESNE